MAASTVSGPTRIIQLEARPIVGLAEIGRERQAITAQPCVLSHVPLHIRACIHVDKVRIGGGMGVSIHLPLLVLAVTQTTTGASFDPIK